MRATLSIYLIYKDFPFEVYSNSPVLTTHPRFAGATNDTLRRATLTPSSPLSNFLP